MNLNFVLQIVYFVSINKTPRPIIGETVILISLDGFRWDYLDLYKQYPTQVITISVALINKDIHPI